MKFLVFGVGGVGAYLATKLSSGGNDVTCIARGPHLAAIRAHGLHLETPDGTVTAHVECTDTPPANLDPDCVIIAVKSFDTEGAARQCLRAIGAPTSVITIQNGVENEDILGRILGKRRIIGGSAYIFSTIDRPGVVRHHGGQARFRIGEMERGISDRVRSIAAAMERSGITCEPAGDIQRIIWEKFIFICGVGGMTAFSRKSVGEVRTDPSRRAMLRSVIHEAAEVGRKLNIDPFTGIEQKLDGVVETMPGENTSSMHYDLTHGKRIELDALNGAVVRFAQKLGVSVPSNAEIVSELGKYARSPQ